MTSLYQSKTIVFLHLWLVNSTKTKNEISSISDFNVCRKNVRVFTQETSATATGAVGEWYAFSIQPTVMNIKHVFKHRHCCVAVSAIISPPILMTTYIAWNSKCIQTSAAFLVGRSVSLNAVHVRGWGMSFIADYHTTYHQWGYAVESRAVIIWTSEFQFNRNFYITSETRSSDN